ncbi:MAG: polysaccharide deacetylase family protein [Fibrobacterota bacterium]
MTIFDFHKTGSGSFFDINNTGKTRFRRLISSLLEAGVSFVDPTESQKETTRLSAGIVFDDAFECVYENAAPFLIDNGIPFIVFAISGYTGKRCTWDYGGGRHRHMNKEMLRNLSKAGIKIGSHGKSHKRLDKMSPESQFSELIDSKKELEDITQTAVTSVSYPFGRYNSATTRCAAEGGYKKGFSISAVSRKGIPPEMRIPIRGVYSFHTSDDLIAMAENSILGKINFMRNFLINRFSSGTWALKYFPETR